jgi:hypothetical protein
LLDAFVTKLVENNPDFDLTGNQYVGAGEIPWDKPGIYVYMGGGQTGQPGTPQTTSVVSTSAITMSVSFYVMIIREVATFGYWSDGGINTASDDILNANGIQAIDDAGALIQAALAIKNDATLVQRAAGFVIGQCTPVGPQGGMAAMRLQLDLSVENA